MGGTWERLEGVDNIWDGKLSTKKRPTIKTMIYGKLQNEETQIKN